jgi:hypothetical protein
MMKAARRQGESQADLVRESVANELARRAIGKRKDKERK